MSYTDDRGVRPEDREELAHTQSLLSVVREVEIELRDVDRQTGCREGIQVRRQSREVWRTLVEMALFADSVDQALIVEQINDRQVTLRSAREREDRVVVY